MPVIFWRSKCSFIFASREKTLILWKNLWPLFKATSNEFEMVFDLRSLNYVDAGENMSFDVLPLDLRIQILIKYVHPVVCCRLLCHLAQVCRGYRRFIMGDLNEEATYRLWREL